ncbi:MAG TPA: HD domain-containing phosphohydrolase [Dehalococcoidia bacterium]|nr:HD domain-containing phosphohydrolase [Dehalococcoidia bacterium]
MAVPADGPALAQTRVAVTASILQFANPLPFIVFDSGGRALIDFATANHEDPTAYVSPKDLDELRTLLRRNLTVIVHAKQISIHDKAWAVHRALLYETSLAFQHVSTRVPVPVPVDVIRDALDFQVEHAGQFPFLTILYSSPYSAASHAVETALTVAALASARAELETESLLPVAVGGLFADSAKLTLPSEMLTRAGPLSDEEWRRMRQHPLRSAEVMHRAGIVNRAALSGAISHHERSGGDGYPDMLRGNDIPVEARWTAIADVYSAMPVDRTFQARVDPLAALTEMSDTGSGGLDSTFLRSFVEMIASTQEHQSVSPHSDWAA